ncbi:MAG: ParB/RepB/Spo0J family partition protein [Bacteroidia bacterium]|nr:ParB/RepB/Spo0J family partition protein [Bacteroidia bacterium]
MSKQGKMVLGKGLGALIPSGVQPAEPVSVVPTPETLDDGASYDILAHVEVAQIDPNPYQPRVDFDSESLRELAQSIRENGLVQPITVRRWEGRFQLISGERRVRACQQAGIAHIPAYIRKVESAEEMLELALIENIQRATLNPVEIAQSYRQLVEDYGHSPEQVAQKVGKDRSTVVNFIRLLKLPKRILESLQKSEITMGHARALITLPDETAQLRTWQRVIRDGLSVRKVEELVKSIYNPQRPVIPPKKTASPSSASGAFDDITRKLRPMYGTKVHITASKDGKGNISFEFYSDDDLERLIELFLSAERKA